MSQNALGCDCNDYSLQTAKTGLAMLTTSNPNLNGTGTLVTVLTAGQNGTLVKSIIIKALQPTTSGMIRLFIGKDKPLTDIALFREIPISTYPLMLSTPTPTPLWPTLEIDLMQEIILKPNYILYASTQNSERFSVIAEALEWNYPEQAPPSCCNYLQETANTGLATISVGSNDLSGAGATTVFTATLNGNGSLIKSITVTALQSTHSGMVRLFVGSSPQSLQLMMEVVIPPSNQSAFIPSFKTVLPDSYHLQSGYIIAASTQLSESFAITVDAMDWDYAA